MFEAFGLLVLTGALWGCTNPFIRQGTKGLRSVRAKGWLAQAWAEVAFLLGNWQLQVAAFVTRVWPPSLFAWPVGLISTVFETFRYIYVTYVVPWLINQSGSLAYLAAVQRTPLSVAVPTANSLAFVFTAVVGAAIGAEEPLDRGSILGIILIVAGTALCCLEKS